MADPGWLDSEAAAAAWRAAGRRGSRDPCLAEPAAHALVTPGSRSDATRVSSALPAPTPSAHAAPIPLQPPAPAAPVPLPPPAGHESPGLSSSSSSIGGSGARRPRRYSPPPAPHNLQQQVDALALRLVEVTRARVADRRRFRRREEELLARGFAPPQAAITGQWREVVCRVGNVKRMLRDECRTPPPLRSFSGLSPPRSPARGVCTSPARLLPQAAVLPPPARQMPDPELVRDTISALRGCGVVDAGQRQATRSVAGAPAAHDSRRRACSVAGVPHADSQWVPRSRSQSTLRGRPASSSRAATAPADQGSSEHSEPAAGHWESGLQPASPHATFEATPSHHTQQPPHQQQSLPQRPTGADPSTTPAAQPSQSASEGALWQQLDSCTRRQVRKDLLLAYECSPSAEREITWALRSMGAPVPVDSVVEVAKDPGSPLGCTWSTLGMRLCSVAQGSPADAAGLRQLIGYRLTHVDDLPVYTARETDAAAAGVSRLRLRMEPPEVSDLLRQSTLAKPEHR
eukprot:TRINITY_DN13215_c0_g2_i2.p1 TRINITY_DN13215_c0_g2~~TRINITY_DN13215_c0_g2_i2.p1  ORF type:complete len:532 (+),score=149.55 TRINITY_DN13215_c0_g2_i2:47-1597(+)